MIRFALNGRIEQTDAPGGLQVLDWIRDTKGLKGTREGCREGDCGACTVLLGELQEDSVSYLAACSCMLPMAAVHGKHLVTIEGLSSEDRLTPFQEAFHQQGASQCGFCTPGMIMSLTGYLLSTREPTVAGAVESLDGNICRCTGYAAVIRAVEKVLTELPGCSGNRLDDLITHGHVPEYFREIPDILSTIPPADRKGDPRLIVAGGTDAYVDPDVSLTDLDPVLLDLPDTVEEKDGSILVSAGATVRTLRSSGVFRTIDHYMARISSTQIRSRATLGGNIMNGSPIGDLAVLFMALGSTVHTRSGNALPLKDLYTGYKSFSVDRDDILTMISFPAPEENSVLTALKVAKREHLDIASVNSVMLRRMDGTTIKSAGIAAGGVAPFPLFLKGTSDLLSGKELNEDLINLAESTAVSEISPISDVRGSAEYKTELLRAQIRAHLTREGA